MHLRWHNILENFTPAWLTVCMGTGAMQQVLVNFWYPWYPIYPQESSPEWMRSLGYCFWILNIVLFGLFMTILLWQWMQIPGSLWKTIVGFPTCSYLGAIPIALDTIIEGLVSYYGLTDNGKWTAFGLYCFNVVLTLIICLGLLMSQMTSSGERHIDQVAGLWLMTTVPLVIIAATGAGMSRSFSPRVNVFLIVVSFLFWSVGMVFVYFTLLCYFWRLIAKHLPPTHLVPSGFLPMAPLSQGATAVLDLSIALSTNLQVTLFTPTISAPPPNLPQNVLWAVSETLHYIGIVVALFMLAQATLWGIQNTIAMIVKRPKRFSIGMWSTTFPVMSYTAAWASLGMDLRNDGMRGFASALAVLSGILWLVCAGFTLWHSLVTGNLFDAKLIEQTQQDNTVPGHSEKAFPTNREDVEATAAGSSVKQQ